MRLLNLRIERFRNLTQVELAPSPRATIAVGPNGQGKTNLLEALYFVITLRPLRASKLTELVQFGSTTASVCARFELGGAHRVIRVNIAEGSRESFVDDKRVKALDDYFGSVAVVAFTPDDLRVVKGSPEGRRQFLDRAIFNRFPGFLREARTYQRALKSRNRLLRDSSDAAYLESYDQALAIAGARIWTRRREFLAEQAPVAIRAFGAIARTEQSLAFKYRPAELDIDFSSAGESALTEMLLKRLREKTERDRERGFTSAGPHVDDLAITLSARPAKSYASQGQQRAIVLGWKIGEIENLTRTTGVAPLLLLDDVSSELDPARNAYLMHYLALSGVQFFLTTTDARLVGDAGGDSAIWYSVQDGELLPRQGSNA